jgi:rubrerythrin
MTLTVGQAVRNAVAAEHAAAQFYRALAALELSADVREFFLDMAVQEDQHAQSIESNGKRLVGGELPERADMAVRNVEAAPEWLVVDDISKESAIAIAKDNEYKAALFYDALADFCPEPEADFFRQLAKTELEHAKRLEGMTL